MFGSGWIAGKAVGIVAEKTAENAAYWIGGYGARDSKIIGKGYGRTAGTITATAVGLATLDATGTIAAAGEFVADRVLCE